MCASIKKSCGNENGGNCDGKDMQGGFEKRKKNYMSGGKGRGQDMSLGQKG